MCNVLLFTTLLTLSLGNVWLEAIELNRKGTRVRSDIGRDEFNDAFAKCPVVQYIRNGNVHSLYKRVSEIPDNFDAYKLFTEDWTDANNMLHEDFDLYSNHVDLSLNQNQWEFCNYNQRNVGYPRECGKQGQVNNEWFTLPKKNSPSPPGLKKGASILIHQSCNCPITGTSDFEDAVCLSHDGKDITLFGKDAFNAAFSECPVVEYTRNGEVHSIYKRLSAIPDDFDAYEIFTSAWTETDNLLHEDFEMYSNYEDLTESENEWQFCNYDKPDVGYPGECGTEKRTKKMWFSFPGGDYNAPNLKKGAGFAVHQACNCPLQKGESGSWSSEKLILHATEDLLMRNRKIATIVPHQYYEVSFAMTLHRSLGGWSSVLHITMANNAGNGDRIPGIFLNGKLLRFITFCNGVVRGMTVAVKDALTIGERVQVTARLSDDLDKPNYSIWSAYIDDREVMNMPCVNAYKANIGRTATVYLSDPWYQAGIATVGDLRYSASTPTGDLQDECSKADVCPEICYE